MAGLVVAGANVSPGLAARDDGSAPAAAASDVNGTFEVLDRTVKSGGTIRVHMLSPRNGLHLALMDGQSHEVSAVELGADADLVTLPAPVVTAPTTFTVVASFADGFGQESVVQAITVTP
jgi:hypothetical protein